MVCSNCGETNIETGIPIGKSAEVGSVGPKYKSLILAGVSQWINFYPTGEI